MRPRALLLCSLLLASAATRAEGVINARDYRDRIAILFATARPAMRNALQPAQTRLFDEIEFSFPIDPNLNRVRAGYRDDGRRSVEVSTGFLQLNSQLGFAYVLAAKRDRLDLFQGYVAYLVDGTREANAAASNTTGFRARGFAEWSGIDRVEAGKVFDASTDYQKEALAAAVLFTTAHEAAHHVLGHVDGESESIAQEWDADDLAIRVVAALGFRTSALVPIAILQDGLQDRANIKGDGVLSCRAVLMIFGAGDQVPDSEFGRKIREDGATCVRRRRQAVEAATRAARPSAPTDNVRMP
jgi:hypothetical protein